MKRLILACVVSLSLGCGVNIHIPVPSADAKKAVTVLLDAQAGLDFAYLLQWLNAADYGTATGILADARAIAQSDPSPLGAVKLSLRAAEQRLPTDSKLRPYVDAALLLL